VQGGREGWKPKSNQSTNKAHLRNDIGSMHNKELKCLNFNATSIGNNLEEMEAVINVEDPDVVGICETSCSYAC